MITVHSWISTRSKHWVSHLGHQEESILLIHSSFLKRISLFLVVLRLCCCTRTFSSGEWRTLFVALHGLLMAVASLVAEHRLKCIGFSSCGTQALVALQHVESSWTRDRIHVCCIGRWILIHCTTREDHVYPCTSDEHLACFHFWALVNNAVVIFGIQVPVQSPFSSSIYLGVELLDELVRVL